MRVEVLLNHGAGASGVSADAVREEFAAAHVDAHVQVASGGQMHRLAAEAAARGVDAVVAGGGDGTVSAVAAALAGGAVPLGVLPVGTLNHFAKDNGLPLDLAGAVRVIAGGFVQPRDLGRINDRTFVNNSSLGVYARALVDRDRRRHRLGMSKWPAMLLASLKVFRQSPLLEVRLSNGSGTMDRRTPLVFVGNNRYELDLFRVGTRSCLDEGILSLYVATTTSRWGMLKLGLRAAFGRLEQSRDFETQCIKRVQVATSRSRVHVAIDGEVTVLTTPLEYSVWPGALRVLVPAVDAKNADSRL